jgi:hypothetical protein
MFHFVCICTAFFTSTSFSYLSYYYKELAINLNMKGPVLRQPCYFADASFPFCVVLNNAATLREATPSVPRGACMATMASFLELDKSAKMVLLAFGTNVAMTEKF